jgi:epoxyqueuosine reductase QueG
MNTLALLLTLAKLNAGGITIMVNSAMGLQLKELRQLMSQDLVPTSLLFRGLYSTPVLLLVLAALNAGVGTGAVNSEMEPLLRELCQLMFLDLPQV